MTFACGAGDNGSAGAVKSQFALLKKYADETFNSAVKAADLVLAINIPNLDFIVDQTPLDYLNIRDPGLAPVLTAVNLGELPGFPNALPDLVLPTKASTSIATPPQPGLAPLPVIEAAPLLYSPSFQLPPTLNFPAVPTYGDLTSGVPFPNLTLIQLPQPPSVDLSSIQFLGIKPTFTAIAPDAKDFKYVDDGYSPLLVNEIKARLTLMLNGQSGLPVATEQAIWARQYERESEQANRAIQEANDDWATRGFTLPGGPLDGKLIKVRQNSQNQRNDLGRAVMIQIQTSLLEQMKDAIAKGVVLEEVWTKLYTSVQDRKLQAARFAIDIAIAVFNANVGLFQAEAEVYKVDMEVYRGRIEAELAKLQVYQAELEAQKLIGELNAQQIQIYIARLSAIETNVKIYATEVQARGQVIDSERLRLEAYKTTIEVEMDKVAVGDQQIKEWVGKLQGQSLIQEAWRSRTETYTAQVQARNTDYMADIERYKGELMGLEAVSSRFKTLVDSYVGHGQFEKARADVLLAGNEQKVQSYSAQVTGDSSFNQALVARFSAISAAVRDQKDLALKNAEINRQNQLEAIRLLEQAETVGAQVLAQLAAGALSSMSVHAGINDTTSESVSCSYSTTQDVSA
jgi:hypothetical protein